MKITPKSLTVLREIFESEYHTLDSLSLALSGVQGNTYLPVLLKLLRHEEYLYRIWFFPDTRFQNTPRVAAYMLSLKGLDAIAPFYDYDVVERARTRVKSGKDVSQARLAHDILRSRFRAHVLDGERRQKFTIETATIKTDLGLVGIVDMPEHDFHKAVHIEPDLALVLNYPNGKRWVAAVEVDMISENASRVDPRGGTTIEKKLMAFESLYDADAEGMTKSALETRMISVIHVIRTSGSSNPVLRNQRMETVKWLIDKHDLRNMRKRWLFLNEADMTIGEPVPLVNSYGEQFTLDDPLTPLVETL